MTVLPVPVKVVLTYSVKLNLSIRTSSCKFIKLKSGLILFFGKREKSKKTPKTAACFSSHNDSVKLKKEH